MGYSQVWINGGGWNKQGGWNFFFFKFMKLVAVFLTVTFMRVLKGLEYKKSQ